MYMYIKIIYKNIYIYTYTCIYARTQIDKCFTHTNTHRLAKPAIICNNVGT